MKLVIIITFVLELFSCGQNQDSTSVKKEVESLVSDSVSYEFVNFILHVKSSPNIHVKDSLGSLPCNVLWKNVADRDIRLFELTNVDSVALVKMDSLFLKDDVDFIFKQLKNAKDFKLNPKFISDRKLISGDTLANWLKHKQHGFDFWEAYKKTFGDGGFCTIAMPLFSKDKSTVIIKIGYYCDPRSAEGGTYIYKKKNGQWTLIRTLDEWIS